MSGETSSLDQQLEIKKTQKAYRAGKKINIAAVSKSRAKSGRRNKIT